MKQIATPLRLKDNRIWQPSRYCNIWLGIKGRIVVDQIKSIFNFIKTSPQLKEHFLAVQFSEQ
uniref:Uncharacterized protein n=1 Tax=Onchocerca volvulus TaxID=6282 RepID=A0A8R1XV01_ONCVO